MLIASKNNHLSYYKNSSKFLFIIFFLLLHISDFSKNCNHPEIGHTLFPSNPSKNWNPTQLLILENSVDGSTLIGKKGDSHHEIMVNFWKIPKQILNL